MPPLTRRQALQVGASSALALTAGCVSSVLGRPQLSLTALNFTDSFHRLYVQLHRADREEASEAFVFDAEYELAARDDEVTAVRDADIVPTHPYLVRAEVDGEARSHYHFYPDCTGHDEPEERLYVEVRSVKTVDAPTVTFGQNGCGGDAWAI